MENTAKEEMEKVRVSRSAEVSGGAGDPAAVVSNHESGDASVVSNAECKSSTSEELDGVCAQQGMDVLCYLMVKRFLARHPEVKLGLKTD